MKNFNILKKLFVLAFMVLCLGLTFGCDSTNSIIIINNWIFTPQQASGTQINVILTGNSLSFDFTVKNDYNEARQLSTETFQVVISNKDNENIVNTIYFDEVKSNINFDANQTKNIVLNAITTTQISSESKITIKYDGKKICEYSINA